MKAPSFHALRRAAKTREIAKFKLTADELAGIVGPGGQTGLHLAADHKCLDQVSGGATARQLDNALDEHRMSALYVAIAAGGMDQIKGGVTAEDLAHAKMIADFSIGLVSGTDGELAELSDGEFLSGAKAGAIPASKDVPQRTGLHWAAYHGGLSRVNGGVTAEQLASVNGPEGLTALHEAARFAHLDQIKGGATFAQLTTVRDKNGDTPLHLVAFQNCLDQVHGGVTAEQLLSVRNHDECTGLHVASSYKHIHGGVSVEQLQKAKEINGQSALFSAARFGCLDQIDGGVTAEQLGATGDVRGNTASHYAARYCCLYQISCGWTIAHLAAHKNFDGETPLDLAIASGHLFDVIPTDRLSFWNELKPEEQALLRAAVKDKTIPASLAAVMGHELTGVELSNTASGYAQQPNLVWDNVALDTLAITRSVHDIELTFPMWKMLFCPDCHRTSYVTIYAPEISRHHCPNCGATYYFAQAEYKQRALQQLKSMRWSFPFEVAAECDCGATFSQTVTGRTGGKAHCPECKRPAQYPIVDEEGFWFDCMRQWLAVGGGCYGWSKSAPRN